MTPNDRRLWIDALTARYLDAVERDDYAAQKELWAVAAQDAELEAAFHEIHAGLLEEDLARTTATIAGAIEKHLPSARIVRDSAGPVTFADVADALFHRTPDGLPPEAHALNAKLRELKEPLPADLGLPNLIAVAEAKFGAAPRDYWRAFRDAAIKLEIRHAAATEYLLAARRAPKPEDRP